jgi:hypothetical protein
MEFALRRQRNAVDSAFCGEVVMRRLEVIGKGGILRDLHQRLCRFVVHISEDRRLSRYDGIETRQIGMAVARNSAREQQY